MKKSKLFMVLLIVTLGVIIMSFTASAEVYSGECGYEGDNVTWTLDTETGLLEISGEGDMCYYYSYEDIPWLSYRNDIKYLIIQDGVTSIDDGAFWECSNLVSITIPDSITTIRSFVFEGCTSLTNVVIPNSVTAIEDAAFSACKSLTSIAIPDSVTYIGTMAFIECENLKSVVIPDSVTDMGVCVFMGCTGLTSAIVSNSITTIPPLMFESCTSLTNVVIPNSVTTIGEAAFAMCESLTSIEIPDSITIIEESAFYGCGSLAKFNVHKNNENYLSDEYGVLYNKDKTILIQFPSKSMLTSYNIPDSVTTIEDRAFVDCYNISDIYYAGTEEDWNKISIGEENYSLLNATIHFNSTSHIHSYEAAITEPTCTSKGYTTYTCSECGNTYTADETEETDHSYEAVITAPTCTKDGYTAYTCTECGANYITDEISATGHIDKNQDIVCDICGIGEETTEVPSYTRYVNILIDLIKAIIEFIKSVF